MAPLTPAVPVHAYVGLCPFAVQVNTSPAANAPLDGVMVTRVGQPADTVVFIIQINVTMMLALQLSISLTRNGYNSIYIFLVNTTDYMYKLRDMLVLILLIFAVFLSVAYAALNKLFVVFIYYWYNIMNQSNTGPRLIEYRKQKGRKEFRNLLVLAGISS